MGTRLLFDALGTTKPFVYRRQLKVKSVSLIELHGQIFGIVLMILLAWYFLAVWTLAVSVIAYSVYRMLASYRLPPAE